MTRSETIKWRAVNPTTFAWEITSPRAAKVVLQKVTKRENVVAQSPAGRKMAPQTTTGYILQVSEISSPATSPSIVINSSDDPEMGPLLQELYTTVSEAATNENVRFLKSLLPPG